jgi:hypothetical protein
MVHPINDAGSVTVRMLLHVDLARSMMLPQLPHALRAPLLCIRACPSEQMVFDPSNIRPAITCVFVAGALLALFYIARARKMRDEREKRRRLYCKSGSFSREMPLPDVPKDVRVLQRAIAVGECDLRW